MHYDHFQKNYLSGITEYFDLLTALDLTTSRNERGRLKTRIRQRSKMNAGLDELIRPNDLILKSKGND